MSNKNISLVLGSGGARGLAHIGVIQWLQENNYTITSISGCSIGSVIGGIYASGQLKKFEEWVKTLSVVDVASFMDISWGNSGLIKGDKLMKTLRDMLGNIQIEDLPISFTAVAADVKNEREVWISNGDLYDAIRASISLPLFLTPFVKDGLELIDGGVLNPIPIAPVFSDNSDLIIAVNLGAKPKVSKTVDSVTETPSSFIQDTINNIRGKETGKPKGQSGMYKIADQAFDAMQNTIARQKLAAYPPDYLIEIPRDACGTLDFHKADEMIKMGYNATKELLSST
ncbi:patatin-like phospholipase family protein [Carboxylicivirga sp. M1479]|uniref:patatin-like phospholipase family protein n=1 Tax=Carboxylicivirga sp. M1479 TaxID=2594476 RepID=UPI0011774C2E|nr:patatin-like phospholipase family protein [Carboxylicivirga sp. M1479]TRX72472.1 serine protease [Carboxylicivirga sp. M1479]